jgi:hypothetical protein
MYDVFISHASEDKESVARPLAKALKERGVNVFFDEITLKLGDNLRESLDTALSKSRYGVVVVSKTFLKKYWTQTELGGLFAKESKGKKCILPIWHEITADEIKDLSPMLADKVAANTNEGIPSIVEQIMDVISEIPSIESNPPDLTDEQAPAKKDLEVVAGAQQSDKILLLEEYLSDERNRIKRDRLINSEVDFVISKHNSDEFEIDGINLKRQGIVTDCAFVRQRMLNYDDLIDTLTKMLCTIAKYDDHNNCGALVTKIIERFLTPLPYNQASYTFIGLQYYPGMVSIYLSGIIAIENENYNYLAALLLKPRYRKGGVLTSPVEVFIPHYVFQQVDKKCVPEFPYDDHSVHPFDYLLHFINRKIGSEFSYAQQLKDKYDIFEYLIALVDIDIRYPDLSKPIHSVPIGRIFSSNYPLFSIIRSQNPDSPSLILDRFVEEGIRQGEEWNLLKAGFFNGSIGRFIECKEALDIYVKNLRR